MRASRDCLGYPTKLSLAGHSTATSWVRRVVSPGVGEYEELVARLTLEILASRIPVGIRCLGSKR